MLTEQGNGDIYNMSFFFPRLVSIMSPFPTIREPEYGYPSLQSTVELAAESNCSFLEIISKASGYRHADIEHKTGVLRESEMLEWLTNV